MMNRILLIVVCHWIILESRQNEYAIKYRTFAYPVSSEIAPKNRTAGNSGRIVIIPTTHRTSENDRMDCTSMQFGMTTEAQPRLPGWLGSRVVSVLDSGA